MDTTVGIKRNRASSFKSTGHCNEACPTRQGNVTARSDRVEGDTFGGSGFDPLGGLDLGSFDVGAGSNLHAAGAGGLANTDLAIGRKRQLSDIGRHVATHAYAGALVIDNDLDTVGLHCAECRTVDGIFVAVAPSGGR
ncbi:hypothetical protein [Neorhizobium sp. JUb45]|uniref:hypothetical protein n=1 Tax=Neorhizobium sp. JUb45 TaxID=2485113 RepID=UPI001FE212CC|nr:hypothetical protein [Neorhizobium sp. JUb45]